MRDRPYITIQEDLPDHPKITAVGNFGFLLYITSICYANRHLTNGVIPTAALYRLLGPPEDGSDWADHALALEREGLWEKTETGWQIHDFLDWNRSAEERRLLSDKRAEAGRRGAAHRWQNGKPMANRWQRDSKPMAALKTETETETETNALTPSSFDNDANGHKPQDFIDVWNRSVDGSLIPKVVKLTEPRRVGLRLSLIHI